jgi:hypothetical protein
MKISLAYNNKCYERADIFFSTQKRKRGIGTLCTNISFLAGGLLCEAAY